tara:strand:- start:108 stop:932 length:825 start_codon:yes stop_codon:yes gene_type:complete
MRPKKFNALLESDEEFGLPLKLIKKYFDPYYFERSVKIENNTINFKRYLSGYTEGNGLSHKSMMLNFCSDLGVPDDCYKFVEEKCEEVGTNSIHFGSGAQKKGDKVFYRIYLGHLRENEFDPQGFAYEWESGSSDYFSRKYLTKTNLAKEEFSNLIKGMLENDEMMEYSNNILNDTFKDVEKITSFICWGSDSDDRLTAGMKLYEINQQVSAVQFRLRDLYSEMGLSWNQIMQLNHAEFNGLKLGWISWGLNKDRERFLNIYVDGKFEKNDEKK